MRQSNNTRGPIVDKHNAEVAKRGPETEPEYDNFGPLSEDEAQALHERIVENVTQSEAVVMDDNTEEVIVADDNTIEFTEASATVEVDDEDAKREKAQAEREAKYRAEREAFNVKDKAFGFQLAKLVNANLSKLSYGGKKVTGAWANENGNIVVTTGGDDTITVHGYGEKYYSWTVDAAILQHAVKLGHEPTEWAWTRDGKFSACERCNAMARIDTNGQVIGAQYMAGCTGKK
jgi:alpha-glucosidase (family GH31 glycosyl hydrolase)